LFVYFLPYFINIIVVFLLGQSQVIVLMHHIK
jgi:hypothetical protein